MPGFWRERGDKKSDLGHNWGERERGEFGKGSKREDRERETLGGLKGRSISWRNRGTVD